MPYIISGEATGGSTRGREDGKAEDVGFVFFIYE
jgi:hypothetical protein